MTRSHTSSAETPGRRPGVSHVRDQTDAADAGDADGDGLDWGGRDVVPALGVVVDEGRGSLPYTLVHGEALVAAAAWGLGAAGVTLLDLTVPWDSVREAGEPFVLHDSLCPLTPPDFIAHCVTTASEVDAVVVGVRAAGDGDGDDADDADVPEVWSPVVLPASVAAGLGQRPGPDLAALVEALRGAHDVLPLRAPSAAMRVGSADDVRLLEELDGPTAAGSDFHSRNNA